MTNQEYKKRFIEALYNRDGPAPKHPNSSHYVIRCPYCGDSSDVTKAHFYIKIDLNDNSPIVYKCFRCPEDTSGIMSKDVMERIGIDDPNLKDGIKLLNASSDRVDKKNINGQEMLYFDYQLPRLEECPKLDYIRDRLGVNISLEEFQDFKVITSLKKFLKLNKIKPLTCPDQIAYMYERDYVGFLSHGNSYILFRDITNQNQISWVKYPITEKSRGSRSFYSISSQIDIFTEDQIIVNLSEGVFDCLGVYYHVMNQRENVINIAVTGRYYEFIMYYLINLGIVGTNVTINIFSDNDKMFGKKNTKSTSIEYYQYIFRNFKYLYKNIFVYINEIGKDCGVRKNQISLVKTKL